eukprot:gene7166-5158_t
MNDDRDRVRNNDQPEAEKSWPESLSTEETASDEILDNESVISEAISQLSIRSFKRQDGKKLLGTIQRLKQENISLREALNSTNVLDLATMRNKLRGANADLVRVRQTNSELREKIQTLEKKIFEMVTAARNTPSPSAPVDSGIPAPVSIQSVKDKLKFLKRSQMAQENAAAVESTATPPPEGTSSTENTSKSPLSETDSKSVPYAEYLKLLSRNRHLERLSQSLEKRVSILQEEALQSKASFSKGSRIDAAEAKSAESAGSDSLGAEKKELTILKERHTRDEKTIRELAAEVKRLTTILSRQKIEEDESVRTGASDLSSSTAPTSSPTLTTEDNLQTSTSTSTANEKESEF